MSIQFEEPWLLGLAVLALPMVYGAIRWLGSMTIARRVCVAVSRVALVLLLTVMLAGATMVRRTERVVVLALVDVSGSVRQFYRPEPALAPSLSESVDPIEAIRGFLRVAAGSAGDSASGRGPDDALGLIVFDGKAAAVAAATRADVLDRPLDLTLGEGTDISAAIRLAISAMPPDAAVRLVLFSDGVETSGDALAAAREATRVVSGGRAFAAGASAVPIDVVPLDYRVQREVIVESLYAPARAPSGSTLTLRVTLHASEPAGGMLRIVREGEEVDINGSLPGKARRLELPAGRTIEQVSVPLETGRLHRFTAIFEPDPEGSATGGAGEDARADTVLINNRAEAFTLTPGEGSVLLIDGAGNADPSAESAVLARTLRRAGMNVHAVAPEGAPLDVLALQEYDLVVLQNVPAEAMPREVHDALAAYVSDLGGGLIMVGGPDSLGAGGWKGTSIEPVLPVRLDLPERQIVPAAAVVIVLDNSGSMNRSVGGSTRSQMDVACEGAAIAVESMDQTDMVGVISFNNAYRVRVPLGPNRDAKGTARLIRSIAADGGTNLPPALEEAHRQLKDVPADVRHVIVLSDGVSMGLDRLSDIGERMRQDGIRISTIAVGDGADTNSLARLAARGEGVYYRVVDPMTLPRVFVKAVRVVRTPFIRQSPFVPVPTFNVSAALEGIDGGSFPPLRALVLTQPRQDSTVVNALLAPTGEPVLAHWGVGLGRAGVFTSDAHDWAAPWLDWPGYSRLWSQFARAMSRPPADRGQELEVEADGDTLRVRYQARDSAAGGVPLDSLVIPATVFGPGGERATFPVVQTGPGTYEGTAPARAGGHYVVTLTPRRPTGERLQPVVGGASRPSGIEYRTLESNPALLRKLAEETGGRVLSLDDPAAARLFDRGGVRPMEARLPLWKHLLPWALALLLFDIAARRIAWDRLFAGEFRAAIARERAELATRRADKAVAAVSRLKERERSVGAAIDAAPPGAAPGRTPDRLGTADAARIVREQRERRRADEEASPAPPQRAQTNRPTPARPPINEPTSPGGGAGSLLDAKRRARERMDRAGSDPSNADGGTPVT